MAYILEGFFIGMFVSLPIGPLGIMSLKRTINIGWKAGFLSGVGAALSDIIYSTTAVFGISIINEFVNKHKSYINIITGILFIGVGLSIFIKALDINNLVEERNKAKMNPVLANFLLGFANPLTFLIFLAVFTRMNLNIETSDFLNNFIFISAIFLGAVLFWLVMANIIHYFIKSFKLETISIVNKVIGIFIILFGSISILLELI